MKRRIIYQDTCRQCRTLYSRIRGLTHFDNFCCSPACYLLAGPMAPAPIKTLTTEASFKSEKIYVKKHKKEKKKKNKRRQESFYMSQPWRELRYKVFKEYGRECMCCGARKHLHVDHIKPRSRYPTLELEFENLQVLCEDCNLGKLHHDETDWRPRDPTTGLVVRKSNPIPSIKKEE